MKKTTKRVISTIMAFCMMVSIFAIMPAYAAEETTSDDIVLNFQVDDIAYSDLTLENNNWAFNLAESSENVATSFGYPNIYWATNIGLLTYPSKYGGKIAIDFTAPAAGWYKVDMDIKGNVKYVNTTKVYVMGSEENQEIITLDNNLFTGSGWVDISEDATFASVYLQEGKNTIMFEAMLTVSTFIALNTITFSPAQPEKVTLNLKSNTNWSYNFAKSGSTVESSIGYPKIYWASDTIGLLMYTNNYDKIALDFYAAADGWYEVNVDASAHSNRVECVKIYTENGNGDIDSVGKITSANFTGAANSWTTMDVAPEFNKVYLTAGKNTIYVAAGAFSTTYFAIKTIEFNPCDAPVVVAEQEVINFKLPTGAKYANQNVDIDGWEFNMEKSDAVLASYLDGTQNHYWYSIIEAFLAYLHVSKKIAVDFAVSEEGWYDVDMGLKGNASYVGDTNVYIEDGADIIKLNNSMFTGTTGTWVSINDDVEFNKVYLNKGVNTLVFESDSDLTIFLGIQNITFTPGEPPAEEPEKVELNLKSNTNWNYNFAKSGSNVETSIGYPNIHWASDTIGLLMYTDKYDKIALDFEVPEDGWYEVNIGASAHSNRVECVKIYTENGNGDIDSVGKITSANFTGAAGSWTTMDVAPEFNKVYLTAGKNTIYVAAGAFTTTYFAIKTIEFVLSDAPVVVAEQEVINFKLPTYAKYANQNVDIDGWGFNMEKSDAALAGCLDGVQNHIWNGTVDGFLAYLHLSKKMAIDFEVSEEGWYDVDMDLKGNAAHIANTNVYIENGANIIKLNNSMFTGTTGTWVSINDDVKFKKVYLNKGVNTLVLEADSDLTIFLGIKTITFTPGEAPVLATGITLDASEFSGEIGNEWTVNATITPADTEDMDVIWTSSDDNVAKVVNGVITAVGSGTATITATSSSNPMLTAKVVVTVAEPEPEYKEGDINGDGRLNTRDVVALRRHIAGGYEGNVVIEAACDMNGDGRLNSRDVKALREFIAG